MTLKEINWHSKTCPCVFVMQFDYDIPTDQRTYTPIACAHGKDHHFEKPGNQGYDVKKGTVCHLHDGLSVFDAFAAVEREHKVQDKPMNIHRVTRNSHSPDTCGCTLQIEFDASLEGEVRPHFILEPLKNCEHHIDAVKHWKKEDHYKDVIAETRKKNYSMGHVIEHLKSVLPDSHFRSIDEDWDGTITKNLKFEPRWSIGKDRKLSIELHRNHAHVIADLKKHPELEGVELK